MGAFVEVGWRALVGVVVADGKGGSEVGVESEVVAGTVTAVDGMGFVVASGASVAVSVGTTAGAEVCVGEGAGEQAAAMADHPKTAKNRHVFRIQAEST